METPFFGGFSQSLSSNVSANRCMNLIPELVETKDGKAVGAFYSTPGQKLLLALSNSGSGYVAGPMRGVRATANNKLVAVFGNQVIQIDINNNVTPLGHLKTASGPVSIIDNGKQYAVFDGFQGWCWNGGTWAQITTIPSFPWLATEQDGFGVVGIYGTNQFYQSNLNDLSIWDPLNFSSADAEPSNIQSIVSLFRQLWVVKEKSVEIWNNAGLNGFVFQRMEGAYINIGCSAPFSVATNEDHVFWLGQSDKGSLQVYMNNGYSEQRISTHPIEYQISSYLSRSSVGIADALGFCYTQAGHAFYVLTFPSGNATWVYDLTTNIWHERGEFLDGSYNRWDPSCYAFFNKQHVVGSSSAQQLSVLDLLYPTDDLFMTPASNPKRWMRRWRATIQAVHAPVRLGSLKIDMQTGSGLGTGFYPDINSVKVAGELGNYYIGNTVNYTYQASGGFNSYTFHIVSGSLPPGLSMSSSGQVTGTPTTGGSYSWTVQAIDRLGNVGEIGDSDVIFAYAYWLTSADNKFFVSQSLTNWTSAVSGIRAPNVDLENPLYTSGYIQPSANASIIGTNSQVTSISSFNAESVSTLNPSGNVIPVVTSLDASHSGIRLRCYDGVLIALMYSAAYYYVSINNGDTWMQYGAPDGYFMNDIARMSNGTWVCESSSGASGGFWYSTQAVPTSWTLGLGSISSNLIGCMCVAASGAFKIGTNNRVFSTANGSTWTVSADNTFPSASAYTVNIFATDGTNVMVSAGDQYVYLTNNNGQSFTQVFQAANNVIDLKYMDGNFLVVDDNSIMSVSSNQGTSWSTITQPSGASSMLGHRTISQVIY